MWRVGSVNSKRVLIVEDSPVIRLGLVELLANESDIEVCGEASDVQHAIREIEDTKPDLVLLDLKLHESSGLDLLKQIRGRSKAKVLVCSVYDASSFAERVVRAGASGFVSKNASADTVLKAVREVLSGRMYVSTEIAAQMLHRLSRTPNSSGEDPVESLSDRELQVFTMIGEGLSIKDIAERLHLSPRTVETYRDNIKNKLSLDSSSDVVRRAAQWVME